MPPAVVGRRAPRVLVTTDAVGGVWTYSLDLARGLSAHGVATVLAVLGPSPTPGRAAEAQAIAGLELVDTGLPLDWTAERPGQVAAAAAAVRALARDHQVDLAHLNSPALATLGGYPVPVLGACHSCLATWWMAVKDGPMPPDFAWRTEALWRGLLACDALVAPTEAFARATASAYEIPPPRVVWNGRATLADAPAVRERRALTTGRLWDEGKNVATLDEAASLSRAPLDAAGPLTGPQGQSVRLRHASPLGALDAGEVAAALRRAPVYASAALYEPFGLGVLEAAQAGCALVLADIPTLRELWDGAAVFVAARDAEGFAAAIDRLMAEEGERSRLAAHARARSRRYSVERMAAGVLEVYGTLSPRFERAPEAVA